MNNGNDDNDQLMYADRIAAIAWSRGADKLTLSAPAAPPPWPWTSARTAKLSATTRSSSSIPRSPIPPAPPKTKAASRPGCRSFSKPNFRRGAAPSSKFPPRTTANVNQKIRLGFGSGVGLGATLNSPLARAAKPAATTEMKMELTTLHDVVAELRDFLGVATTAPVRPASAPRPAQITAARREAVAVG